MPAEPALRALRSVSLAGLTAQLLRILRGPFGRWLVWSAAGLGLLVISGYTLDHPIARYVHERLQFSRNARRMVHIPELLTIVCIGATVLLGAWSAFVGKLSGLWRQVLQASLSLCIALTLTGALKIWFGRIPPERWYFHQWHNFYAYLSGSFPSGHMTALAAVAPFVWARSNWLMAALLLAGAATAYGLVMQQAHFISDLFGGILVGGSVGYAMRCADQP